MMKKTTQPTNGHSMRHDFDQWARDVDVLFHAAMQADNFVAALKAKELLAKANGWLMSSAQKDIKPLSMLSNHDIDTMIRHLEQHDRGASTSSDCDV